MDVPNALRQAEEILSLQDKWYGDAITITTPALFRRLKRVRPSASGTLDVKKCLSFRISCAVLYPESEVSDLVLQVDFPLDYPSHAVCLMRAFSAKAIIARGSGVDEEDPSLEYEPCTAALHKYLVSFCGIECVELALEWIEQNKGTCLLDPSVDQSNKKDDEDGKVQCYVLRYNHLLSGPEHKKEKSMVDTAKKSKLQGGILWGTPGVVIVVPPSTEEDAKDYGSECRAIGKRPDGVESTKLTPEGIERAGLGGLAQQKRGGRLQDLTTATLRDACGGDQELLRTLLGIR